MCRPRFFAGQLLTEEDLNRLDRYIVEKNKLHNRYLHGWGVVCGLEVFCHPCEGQVTVTSGYALSPCGDDIVLCANDIVNVCDLIQRCRERERLECEPPRPAANGGVPGCHGTVGVDGLLHRKGLARSDGAARQQRTGVLLELQLRRLLQLRLSGKRHEPEAAGAGRIASARSLSTDARSGRDLCEPTVTCESHYFSLYKASAADPKPGEELGSMLQRFDNCMKGLFEAVPALPTNIEQSQAWCCQLKQNWIDLFADHPIHDCLALQKLSQFVCPAPVQNQTPEQYMKAVLEQLAPIGAEYIRSCLCSALLPPCPDPVASNCVPLATITIRKRDCKIMRVCNWSARKFVTTFPNLQYWFSFLPFMRLLREAIETVCCRPFRRLARRTVLGGRENGQTIYRVQESAMEINPEQEFSRVRVRRYTKSRPHDRRADALSRRDGVPG